MSLFSKIFGDSDEKFLKKAWLAVEQINGLEKEFAGLSDEELKKQTKTFKERLAKGEGLDQILPLAFALVREAAKRTLGQRHFDVQLIGGLALHQGKIAEMKTGEGKTLAATLPVYLNALSGKGAHVVTVNDYLAKRDAVWMGQIYDALGLSVGCLAHEQAFVYSPYYQSENSKSQILNSKQIQNSKFQIPNGERDKIRDEQGGFKVVESFLKPVSRKEAYGADITYGTNNEFGFDYLRDNMVMDKAQKVQRGFHFVVVDEIDSILIDEARTPLIISQPDLESSRHYSEFARIIPKLIGEQDYTIDEESKTALLTEPGIDRLEKILGVGDIYNDKGIKYLHHLEQALRAEEFFKRDRDYIVKDGEVIIIDEFTGRLMPGRRWSGGLHQAVEAKEGVRVKEESTTLATITFQNYFRFYEKLSGMTGTALTSAEEFDKVYKLEVVVVPTNKPLIRQALPDVIYKTDLAKLKAAALDVKKRHEKGQPVLIGTRSVEKNEYVSKLLFREGIKHEVLNAKNHQREGEIIAQAGRLGAVTVATNMAGRGVDIILGGSPPSKEEAEKIKELGGLHVLGTERHEARRIDDQLRGRSGRQGDPGSSQFFVSLEDDLMRIFGGERIKAIMERFRVPEDMPIGAKIISSALEKAQSKVEGMHFDIRHHILEYDDVIAKHRGRIYRERDEVLEKNYQQLKDFVLQIIFSEIEKILGAGGEHQRDDLKTILPLSDDFPLAPEKLKARAKEVMEKKAEKEGEENVFKIMRFAILRTIDFFWCEHLYELEHLKDSVRLRAYGGKDPLIEYKSESHRIFQQLQAQINQQIARTIFKLTAR